MLNEGLRVALCAVALCAGCATTTANPTISLRYDKSLDQLDLASVMRRAGPGPVGVVDLGHTAWVSESIAVVREGEQPHYHRFHDLTVVVLRGEGVMDIEGKRFFMKPGDVVHINRGVRHYFRNTSKDEAAAFVVFSPPFDGRDTVTAEPPAEEKPAPAPSRPWWKLWGRNSKGTEPAGAANPVEKTD
jgi:mannose-6-phosphate isomerase-like protein (cupin superfamily)